MNGWCGKVSTGSGSGGFLLGDDGGDAVLDTEKGKLARVAENKQKHGAWGIHDYIYGRIGMANKGDKMFFLLSGGACR